MSSLLLLLDEGVPKSVYKTVLGKGYSALRVQDLGARGMSNSDVLKLASVSGRVLVTRDADFLKISQMSAENIRILYLEAYPDEPNELSRHLEAHIEECLMLLKHCQIVLLRVGGAECLRR